MKNRTYPPLPLLALLLLAWGCASPKGVHEPAGAIVPDEGQVWQLTEMRGRPTERGGQATTLVFNAKTGYLNGTTACNTYSATYSLDATHALKVGTIRHGQVACPDPQVGAQDRYLATLAKADRLEATATTLILYQSNRIILKYELQ